MSGAVLSKWVTILGAVLFGARDALHAGPDAGKPPPVADPEYLIETWETEQGLPENSATAMVQTPDGYLWFGTFNGLVRFDGARFVVFDPSNTPALPSAGVVNLHLDRSERLWISTYRGLAILEPDGRWRRPWPAGGEAKDSIRSFAEDSRGTLLLTSFDGEVLECSGESVRSLRPPPSRPSDSWRAYVGTDDRWRLMNNRTIVRWDGRAWLVVEESADLDATYGCAPARDGGAWILRGTEIRKLRNDKTVATIRLPEPAGGLWSMFEDTSGDLWLATFDRGVCRVSPDGRMRRWTIANGLGYDGARFAFEDHEGNLWIGTSGGGLSRFRQRRFHMFGVEAGLAERNVKSVWPAPDGSMLVATYGKGYFRIGADGVRPLALPDGAKPAGYAQSVLADRAGRIWLGGYQRGALMLDGDRATHFPPDRTGGGNIIALFEDSRGRIWISGGDGVAVYRDGQLEEITSNDGDPWPEAHCFGEDQDGAIWMSSRDAVYRQDGDRFVEIKDRDGRAVGAALCLESTPDGSMWMGTRHRGLLRWRAGQLDTVDARHGLPVRSIYGIVPDDQGAWWMSSDSGVVRARFDDLAAVADGSAKTLPCQHLDTADGLATPDCTGERQPVCARDPAGRIWFATLKGAAVIDPRRFHVNDLPPPVRIEELAFVDPRPSQDMPDDASDGVRSSSRLTLPLPADPVLPAGSRQVSVRYTAMSFAAPAKVHFQIRLDGLDDQWRTAGNERTATFGELAPGSYVLRVRAANNDGVWNEAGVALPFAIEPHLWETTWFRSALLAGLIALGAGSTWFVAHARAKRRAADDERFRQVVETTPSAIVMIDQDRRVVLVNSGAERCFGTRRTEMLGAGIDEFIPDWTAAAGNGSRDRAVVIHDLAGRRRDGTVFPIDVQLGSMENPSGAFVLACITDLTERQRIEQALARQRDELAHLSRVTTLGELSGSMAHELNQPLTSILSNAQAALRFLDRSPVDLGEVREILDDIVTQDKRAGDIILRLRRLLQKGETQPQPQDIGEVLHESLKLVRADLAAHQISLDVDVAPDLPPVLGDRVQLQQV
ncbi:MAG: PAS domain S-box protein, partial [Phycisphaerales bacterium]|nr:PAS domain S-box protein [Phycisphaerales bacterium]